MMTLHFLNDVANDPSLSVYVILTKLLSAISLYKYNKGNAGYIPTDS